MIQRGDGEYYNQFIFTKQGRSNMRVLDIKEVQAMQLELMKKLHAYLGEKNIPYYLLAGSVLGAKRHDGFIPWDDDIDIGMFRSDFEKFLSVCDDFDKSYDIVNYRNCKNCDNCLTRIYFPSTMIDNKSIAKTKLDKRLYLDIFPLDNAPEQENERIRLEKKVQRKKRQIILADVRNYNNTWYVLSFKKACSIFFSMRRKKLLLEYDHLIQKYNDKQTAYVCSMCSQYSFSKQTMPREYYGTPRLKKFEDTEFYVPDKSDLYLRHLYGDNYMEIPPKSKQRKGFTIYKLDEE